MKFKLRLFASFREAFGATEVEFELKDGSTAGDLVEKVIAEHPDLERFRGHVVVTVNKKSVRMTESINEGDEVAILPPVSGG